MKRAVAHTVFWTSYLVFRTIIEYEWAKLDIPEINMADLPLSAASAAFIGIIPEAIFAYYIAFRGLDNWINKKKERLFTAVEILLVLMACIYAVRILVKYIVSPLSYRGHLEMSAVFEYSRIIGIIFYICFCSGMIIAIESVSRQFNASEREKALIREKYQAELKALRNQMNPHFLFNTLNNIYVLTRKKSDKAPEAVMKLSDILSYTLYNAGLDSVAIGEEVKILQDYISLEKIRYDERLSVRFDTDIEDNAEPILPLLLLPLVENAFKHGISENRFDAFIHIFLSVKARILNLSVENSVNGGTTSKNSLRLGLNNTRRQLELLYKTYDLNTEQQENIFRVSLTINLNSHG